MAKVFISYSHQDSGRVRPLAQALEGAGHTVWWDQHITGGDQFAHVIEQALDSAGVVVVVWTEASCLSSWVRDEAAAGRDSNRLVPICFDGCTEPLGFRQFQAIDFGRWNGRANSPALESLKQAISAKAVGSASALTVAPVPKAVARQMSAWLQTPFRIGAAVVVVLLAAAALLLVRTGLFASNDSMKAKVALGQFALISSDVPQSMSLAMHDEILAAFGTENAVAVTVAADSSGGRPERFLLGGSIRRDADALRFTVSLSDNLTGTVLWTRAFDRAAADVLATRQIAVAASQVVRCGLWGASAYPRRIPDEALSRYLHLCDEQWGGSPDDQRIFEAARRVTSVLPDFSFGWSALALAAVPLSHGIGSDAAAIRDEGLKAARRARKLDNENPEGYMAEAGLLPTNRFAEREELLMKAISVRPTECGCERTAYGDFLSSVGRMEEAIEQYQRAQAIMPLSPAVTLRLAHALYLSDREEEADRITLNMLTVWPDAVALRQVRVKSALWTKRYDEALAMLEEPGLHLTQSQIEALRATFEALRSNDSAAKAAAVVKLEEMARDSRRNDRLVVAALAAVGAESSAIEAAQRLIGARGHPAADVLFEPNLAAASGNPQYSALVSKLGLAHYWRTTKRLPDICRREATLSFCNVT